MGTVIGITALVGVAWLFATIGERFWTSANQRVLARAQHAEGQRLTHERLVIHSAVDPATLQDALVRGLALPYDKPAAAHAEIVQGPVEAGHVRFCSGTRARTVFTAGMRLEPDAAGGSTLTYAVETWTLSDGIVAGIPQLRYLRRRIEAEARAVDPRITVDPGVHQG